MHIRRVLTLAVAVATLAGAPVLVAQQNDRQNRREQERRSQAQQRDTQALVQLVDGVRTGKQPAPTDIGVAWESNHFARAGDGSTYVPFTLVVDAAKLAAPGTAVYVRVMSRNAAPAAEQNNRGRNQQRAAVYPWDQVYFPNVNPDGKVSRSLVLKPGEYEVFIAVKEQSPLEPQRNQPPAKAGLLLRDLTVPDFNGPDLSTSTPIIATAIEPLATPLTPEQQRDNPYTFGGMLRVVPANNSKLKNADDLQVMFWVYGTQHTAGKPDVEIEYNFHQKTAEGEKYFNKTKPQVLNTSTLPAEFDVTAGHQVLGMLAVPLKSFPVGDYRLEFKITDKISGKTLTQNASFTVES